MGEIGKGKILDIFDRFPWTDLAGKMKGVDESLIHYAPTLEIENKANQSILSITYREEQTGNKFNIFYTRPKTVASFFGLIKNTEDNYFSEREGLALSEVRDAVKALATDDLETMERRWG